MDDAQLSRFPRETWLHFRLGGTSAERSLVLDMRSVAHSVSLTARGRRTVRAICRAHEMRWEERAGTVHFQPADGEDRTFITRMSPDCEAAVFLIPRGHLRGCLDAEGLDAPVEFRRFLAHDDHVLQACLTRLTLAACSGEDTAATAADEAARRLILRLAERSGAGRPDWHDDESTFDRRTLLNLVRHIDAHLQIAPRLADMALLTGLSPSHFAKKFRHSTGLSLHRFINRRRVLESLEQLKSPTASLAEVSLELGFSSQSHFTRLFSSLTGLTPARYAKQFRR